MKKIVALGAAAALVGGLFAAEPVSNPSLVSFNGNASVEWGVDLDAGKTGFKNGTWTEMKIKLFDNGDKSTSGDDVWAELVMKVDDEDSCGPNGWQDGKWKGGKNAYIDVAKLHFGNIYVGIKSGDTKVGELDFLTAVRSADPWFHPGRWLKAIGPDQVTEKDDKGKDVHHEYSQGIVAGYEDDNLNIGVDFRSLDWGQYTNSYAVAAEAKLKETNSFAEGLSAGLGAAYNLSDSYFDAENKKADEAGKKATEHAKLGHTLAYTASVGYKLKIDDTYWLKPQAGIEGALATTDYDNVKTSSNYNVVAAGLMFGWGNTNSYGNTGTLYYFDDDWGDKAKGLTPGLSAVAYIPFDTIGERTTSAGTWKTINHNALKALIVPSVYSGDLVENLKFAVYSEMGIFDYKETVPTAPANTTETWAFTADKKNTFALALAAGVKYDIKADNITITPKASARYANTCYVANKASIDAAVPASDKTMFKVADFGEQKTETTGERTGFLAGDFFNLEAGVEVGGLIPDTTFSVHYKSANLMNLKEYNDKTYNVKLGTLNVGCKIAF